MASFSKEAKLHCKFKRSVSAPKCRFSSMAPGADLALRGSILSSGALSTAIKTVPAPSKNRFGPQWKTIQPLDAYRPSSLEPFWLKLVGPFPFKCSGLWCRAVSAPISGAVLTPKNRGILVTTKIGPITRGISILAKMGPIQGRFCSY